jgi:hypothetical protein
MAALNTKKFRVEVIGREEQTGRCSSAAISRAMAVALRCASIAKARLTDSAVRLDNVQLSEE